LARRSLIPGLPILSTKADAAPTPAAVGRQFSSARIVRTSGQPYRSNWELERAITDGAQRSIWTFKAIDAIAKTTAMLPIDILQGFDPETAEPMSPEHNPMLWKRLNRMANKYEFSIGFRYRLMSQLLLSPRGVFVEVQRDREGNIHHLFLLNPDKTAPIPDARTFVSGYEVDNNGHLDFIPPENVLWIRIPHPTRPVHELHPAGGRRALHRPRLLLPPLQPQLHGQRRAPRRPAVHQGPDPRGGRGGHQGPVQQADPPGRSPWSSPTASTSWTSPPPRATPPTPPCATR
jgi:hypothetical protein